MAVARSLAAQPTEQIRSHWRTMPEDPRLTLTGVVKSYGAVKAIRHADFELQPGQVHALVGENGAGKSTLIKIISGATAPDAGTHQLRRCSRCTITSTVDAIALGIATVYQEPQLFAELTVAENVFMGREIVKRGRVDWAAQNERVVGLLEALDLPAKLTTATVGDLSVATQQQVSIAKALAGKCGILILDEPSAILTDAEIEVLFGIIRRLADDGVAIIYISHRLDEVVKIADQVTVMRDGSTIGTYPVEDMSVRRMAELMVGEALSEQTGPRAAIPTGKPRPRAEVTRAGRLLPRRQPAVAIRRDPRPLRAGRLRRRRDRRMHPRAGQGQRRRDHPVEGRTHRAAHAATGRAGRDRAAARQPQDRGHVLLSVHRLQRLHRSPPAPLAGRAFVDRARGTHGGQGPDEAAGGAGIRRKPAPSATLSGGNAQKVVLARQLVERPKLLLLAEPTQGVDIGAKEEIHRIITDLADNGTAVLVVTSDLQEALRIADRLLVVRAGTIAAEFGPDARQVDVLAAAAGDTKRRPHHEHHPRSRAARPPRPSAAGPGPSLPGHARRDRPDRRDRRALGRAGLRHAGIPQRGLDHPAARSSSRRSR